MMGTQEQKIAKKWNAETFESGDRGNIKRVDKRIFSQWNTGTEDTRKATNRDMRR